MSTSAAASKLLRFTNTPLQTLIRPTSTSAAAAATTTTTHFFTFNITKTNPQNPEEFKPNGHTETLIFQPNVQNQFGFSAAVDHSKAKILSRQIYMRDDRPANDYDDDNYDFHSDSEDDGDPYEKHHIDESDYSDAYTDEDDSDDDDIKPRRR